VLHAGPLKSTLLRWLSAMLCVFCSNARAPLLTGLRGSTATDIDALSEIAARVSELADDHRATIAEMDFNPLICGCCPSGICR
jgi:hypothetical protein